VIAGMSGTIVGHPLDTLKVRNTLMGLFLGDVKALQSHIEPIE